MSWYNPIDWFSSTPAQPADALNSEPESIDEAFSRAQKATASLKAKQEEVDTFLSRLANTPGQEALANRLSQTKSESRGFFDAYVVPAWDMITEAFNSITSGEAKPADSGVGFLPLIIGGIALTSMAIIALCVTYVETSQSAWEREQAILNDPSIPAGLKEQLLATGGGLTGTLMSAKGLVFTALAGVAGIMILKTLMNPEARAGLGRDARSAGGILKSGFHQAKALASRSNPQLHGIVQQERYRGRMIRIYHTPGDIFRATVDNHDDPIVSGTSRMRTEHKVKKLIDAGHL